MTLAHARATGDGSLIARYVGRPDAILAKGVLNAIIVYDPQGMGRIPREQCNAACAISVSAAWVLMEDSLLN